MKNRVINVNGSVVTLSTRAGLNIYKISVKEWLEKTNAIGLQAVTRHDV